MSARGISLLVLGAADGVDLALDDDAVEPRVVDELGRLGALVRVEAEHGVQERRDHVRLLLREEVLVVQHGV